MRPAKTKESVNTLPVTTGTRIGRSARTVRVVWRTRWFRRRCWLVRQASIRQFTDTIRAVIALTPTELRASRRRGAGVDATGAGQLTLRLPFRAPLDAGAILDFLSARSIDGVEHVADGVYQRAMRLPHGTAASVRTSDHGSNGPPRGNHPSAD